MCRNNLSTSAIRNGKRKLFRLTHMSACSNLSTAKSWVIFADQNKLNKLTMIFWGACCNKSALEHRLATKSARIANNSQFRRHMELAVHWIRIPMISIPGCLVYCRLSFPSDFTISLSCEMKWVILWYF